MNIPRDNINIKRLHRTKVRFAQWIFEHSLHFVNSINSIAFILLFFGVTRKIHNSTILAASLTCLFTIVEWCQWTIHNYRLLSITSASLIVAPQDSLANMPNSRKNHSGIRRVMTSVRYRYWNNILNNWRNLTLFVCFKLVNNKL